MRTNHQLFFNRSAFLKTSAILLGFVVVALVILYVGSKTVEADEVLSCEVITPPLALSFGNNETVRATQGDTLSIPITVQNTSDHLSTFSGSLVGVIVRGDEIEAGFPVSPYDFVVAGTVPVLAPGATHTTDFDWEVPEYLARGEYLVVFFHETADPRQALQKVFTDLSGVGAVAFSVFGEPSGRTEGFSGTVAVRGGEVLPSGHIAITDPQVLPSFALTIDNVATSSPLLGTITWEVFAGNTPNSELILSSQRDDVKLLPERDREYTFTLPALSSEVVTVLMHLELENDTRALRTFHVVKTEHNLVYQMPAIGYRGFTQEGIFGCARLGNQMTYADLGWFTATSTIVLASQDSGAELILSTNPLPTTDEDQYAAFTLPWSSADVREVTLRGDVAPLASAAVSIDCAIMPCSAQTFIEQVVTPAEGKSSAFYLMFILASLLLAFLVVRRLPKRASATTTSASSSPETVMTVPMSAPKKPTKTAKKDTSNPSSNK